MKMTSWFFPEFRVWTQAFIRCFRFYYKSDVTLGFIDGLGVKVSIHNNPAEWTLKGAYAYTNSEDLWGHAWDYALLTLRFKRRSWYYVMEVFFPTIMFLLISYAGFFVARESAPARVATAVLPVLILRTRVSPASVMLFGEHLATAAELFWMLAFTSAELFGQHTKKELSTPHHQILGCSTASTRGGPATRRPSSSASSW